MENYLVNCSQQNISRMAQAELMDLNTLCVRGWTLFFPWLISRNHFIHRSKAMRILLQDMSEKAVHM